MSKVMVRVSKEIVEAYVRRYPEFKSVSTSNIVRVMLQKTLDLEEEFVTLTQNRKSLREIMEDEMKKRAEEDHPKKKR